MSEALDSIKKEIAQLSDAVKSAGSDKATLDYDKLAGAVADLLAKQQASQADNKPQRRGEVIEPIGGSVKDAKVDGGKFDGMKATDLIFVNWLMDKASGKGANVQPRSKHFTDAVQKALTATGAGTGDEYVPTGMASELWNDMFLDSRVASQFSVVSMPTDPFDYPIGWGDVTWRKGTQNTATTVSDPATAKGTLTSTEQICEIDFSYDLDEDSIVAILPTLKQLIGRNGAESIDRFVMNADSETAGTGNVNTDDAAAAASDYFLSNGQNGLRRQFIVDNVAQKSSMGAAITDAGMRAGLALLGKYAGDINRLVWFADPATYVTMLGLTYVVTVDKFGPQATVLSGQLSNYGGIPVVVTPSIVRTDTDGKYTTTSPSTNDTKGTIVLAHRDMWRVGYRRSLLVEFDRFIQTRKLVLVASYRIAVGARGTRSTAVHTAGIYNIT